MTAQISDRCKYRCHDYAIAGIAGRGLFDPADHEIHPFATCTACWRGYVCAYAIEEGGLKLRSLAVSFAQGVAPPPISGVVATEKDALGMHVYRDFPEPIPFTGGLLLADGFIRELYVHMGFHPAYKYRKVVEFIFDGGRLVQAADRSARMKEIRRGLALRKDGPASNDERDVRSWIETCFSLDYKR
jgi:hypothetical protein